MRNPLKRRIDNANLTRLKNIERRMVNLRQQYAPLEDERNKIIEELGGVERAHKLVVRRNGGS